MDRVGGFCQQLLNQNKGGTFTYPTAAFMAFGYNSCEADTGLIERFDLRCIGHFEIPIPPVGRGRDAAVLAADETSQPARSKVWERAESSSSKQRQ